MSVHMTTTTVKVQTSRHIVLLGGGGAGMRGLGYLLTKQGRLVSALDSNTAAVPSMKAAGLTVVTLPALPRVLETCDLVIYTDALSSDDQSLRQARASRAPVLAYHEALAQFAEDFSCIAITGTHGKTSTTAMLGHILIAAGYDPTVLVGSSMASWGNQNARAGHSPLLVVEADDYRNHFLSLQPTHAIVTSIDFDHPDFFTSLEHVEKSIEKFLSQLKPGGRVVTSKAIQQAHTSVFESSTVALPTVLPSAPLPGEHMRHNAALAVTMATLLGVPKAEALHVLHSFNGLSRRLEMIGSLGNLRLISDYGHHPVEIAATAAAALQEWPNEKILFIIEPHTVERLTVLFDLFVSALQKLDGGVLIAPVYQARQQSAKQARASADLFRALKKRRDHVYMLNTFDQLEDILANLSSNYTMAIAFTAGVLDGHLRRLVS